MPRMSLEERSERLVRFLMGLRDPEVAAAMREHGFTEEDRREGYRLLEAHTADTLPDVPVRRERYQDPLKRLDAFENHWFPIVDASLRNRFPAAHEWTFHDLGQTSGTKVVVSVRLFLDRIETLPEAKVEGAREAAALLA